MIRQEREILKNRILGVFHEVARSQGVELAPLEGNTVLLESGLDSLGFAIVVARLEEELGYDPFVIAREPIYPRTVDDFVDIYGDGLA